MSKHLMAGGAALALCAVLAGPAGAHHSFAMFDSTQTMNTKATVVQWQWTNPHSFLECTINGQQWNLESGSPGMITHVGASRLSFKPGDIVTVSFHPRRDKTLGGQLLSATGADGKVYPFDSVHQPLPPGQ